MTEERDATALAARLRELATGTVEWRVQHPVDKCYCIAFSFENSVNPRREAREWLEDFRRRYPDHEHAKHEVAEVRWFSALEQAALEAAELLGRPSEPTGTAGGAIRQLPAVAERVETGPVQFGDDWPGVFIRGDSAFAYAMALRAMLRGTADPFSEAMVMGLADTLASSDLTGVSKSPPSKEQSLYAAGAAGLVGDPSQGLK